MVSENLKIITMLVHFVWLILKKPIKRQTFSESAKPVVLKLCVATPWCIVSIFQRRHGIFWFCAIKSRFYCVKRTLIVDSFLTFFCHFRNSVFNTLLQRLTCYSRIKLKKFNLIGEKYIKNKAFSCMLDENRKNELKLRRA